MAKKILVVDDSSTVRQQVGSALAGAGYEIVEASDGLDGVAVLSGSDEFAAVICDVNMPRMTGLEMLEKVKAEPKNATLPILMLTTEGHAGAIQRAKAA